MNYILRAVVVFLCSLLAACNWYVRGGKDEQRGVWVEGGVSGQINKNSTTASQFGFSVASVSFVFDSINTQLVTSTGQFTASLYDDQGDLLSSEQFNFFRNGSTIYPSAPPAITTWAMAYPEAVHMEVALDNLTFQDASSGVASVSTSVRYGSAVTATTTQNWNAYGGQNGGCPPGAYCLIQ